MQGQYRGDFTRDTFDPLKHFTRVLSQQGRVQLDADWNEQAAILLHYLRTLAADLIGEQGGPEENAGFEVSLLSIPPPVQNDFRIGPGHYYVDGILCELEATPIPVIPQQDGTKVQVLTLLVDDLEFQPGQYVEVYPPPPPPPSPSSPPPNLAKISAVDLANRTLTFDGSLPFGTSPMIRRLTTYLAQPDYPVPPVPTDERAFQLGNPYFVYLDVWERHVTYVEDDSIREVALGGPDTAARAKVVWQVKILPAAPKASCDKPGLDAEQLVEFQRENRSWLKAKAREKSASTDPCIIPPDSKYRGAENQLYRVEIHRKGQAWDGTGSNRANAATFKWSRENGSVVFPILDLATDSAARTTVTLENLGRDDRFGLAEGDWVEIVDDDYVLQNRAEPLLKVSSIERTTMTVTLNGLPASNVGQFPAKHPLLRRWDQKQGERAEGGLELDDGAALIVEDGDGNWLSLEDGVQIQFQKADAGQSNQYRTSDYWLIPARTATGDVEWPTTKDAQGNLIQLALAPHGVEHHYAPLAIIKADGSVSGCRHTFKLSEKSGA